MNNAITHYPLPTSATLTNKLQTADALQQEIDHLRPFHLDIWATIQQKLRIRWTYDSNAIEGSTLTYGETAFFLQYGLTTEGKPLKDFLDARNHANAIDWLIEIVREEREITESLLKEMNALLLFGIQFTPAVTEQGQPVRKPATPGQYKRLPNHVLRTDGTIH